LGYIYSASQTAYTDLGSIKSKTPAKSQSKNENFEALETLRGLDPRDQFLVPQTDTVYLKNSGTYY